MPTVWYGFVPPRGDAQASALLEGLLTDFRREVATPDRAVIGLGVVVEPLVVGGIRPGLGLSLLEIHPAENVPRIATIRAARVIEAHVC